jgi:hypothetical protein
MVICGGNKQKTTTSKQPRQPVTQTPSIEEKIQAPEPSPKLMRQKSFYATSEDVYPIKVDFLKTNSADQSDKKQRFVVLTDSALIVYDEMEHPSTGQYNFVTQHFLLNNVTIDVKDGTSIKIMEDNRWVTLNMRSL